MKLLLKIALSAVILLVIVIGAGVFIISRGLDTVSQEVINSVNAAALKDGNYNGKYDVGRWANEVTVIVKDKKITDIKLIKDVTFSSPACTEQIFKRVIEKQNVNVDVVTGATVTSKAYLKSIENALK